MATKIFTLRDNEFQTDLATWCNNKLYIEITKSNRFINTISLTKENAKELIVELQRLCDKMED